MIEVSHISKSFGEKKVLDDVSCNFEKGITNLIIGASGTGKSVLLKCVVGIVKPDAGSVCYDGRDFVTANEEGQKDIRREMGMLFQGSALFDSKTVEQNVMFPLDMLTDMSKSEKNDRVNFCLQRVGLDHAAKLFPSEISGGMQKRVGIARAIVMNPKYLFCDEPNSGLDPQTAIRIDNLISEITEEFKTTTVIVTHDMNSVMTVGEYVAFIYKGRKLWEGNKKTIMESGVQELDEFIFASKLMNDLKYYRFKFADGI
ncbi:MAG: ATP-binding cassette domain-containing protein [Cytophagales bacterium]